MQGSLVQQVHEHSTIPARALACRRKDGLMRPWELVARDPHMRDASGRPAQHAFHSGRPGTGSGGAAASAGAAGREEEEAAAAAGGGHRARRGRPVREMSEAEQEAWHASWQLPAGYLPAGAVPQERRAAERRPGATNAAGRGEEAQQAQQEQPGRRQQWQQLVAWDGEGEAGQQAVQQQEHGHMHVRPEGGHCSAGVVDAVQECTCCYSAPAFTTGAAQLVGPALGAIRFRASLSAAMSLCLMLQQTPFAAADWEAPLHGARWEAPALPLAGRQRQQGGAEGGANAEQQAQPQQPRQQQQQPQQPQQQQSPPRQEVQRQAVRQRQPPSTPQQVRQRPAVRVPVALASLVLQEADLFGEATAARPRPQQPPAQQQQRVVVRHAAPVQAPSRSEMQALIQAEREAELRRVQQQLEAAMEAERLRQRAAASLGGAMRTARAGGAAHSSDSCDTWGAAVRGNLLGGEDGQREAEWEEGAEEEWEEGAEEEWEEEEGQDAQQMQQQQEQQQQLAQQEQARERKRARRRRQRQRKRQRLRQQEQEEEEEEEEEEEGSGQERCRLSTQTLRELISAMSPDWVTAALEGELWQGKHPELQPLPASLRRKLGALCAAQIVQLQAMTCWQCAAGAVKTCSSQAA